MTLAKCLRRLQSIEIVRITSWRVAYEMCFDLVVLDLGHAGEQNWPDYDNDLLSILRECIPQLESESQ